MKKALFSAVLLLTFSLSSFSLTIPKKLMGQYDAEVPAFEFEDNGRTVKASGYTISLILKEEFMWYKTGKLTFRGDYKDVIENGDLVDIDIEISNDISIAFDLGLSVNKKTGFVAIKGLKGVPEVTAEKRQIVVTKKNKGFKRL